MQYKKMTKSQKVIKTWRKKRNLILKRILDADKTMSTTEAMKMANREAGRMP